MNDYTDIYTSHVNRILPTYPVIQTVRYVVKFTMIH